MKLNVKALAFAFSLTWGGAIFVTHLANFIWPGYGEAFLQTVGSVYPGYSGEAAFLQVILGTIYGLLDGFIGGLVLGWLYNLFSGKSSAA